MIADLLARAALVLAAVAAVVLSAPAPVGAALAAAAALAVGDVLVRRRALGLVDAVLVGTGGALVTLVVLGALLGLTGIGLRPAAWAVALGVTALAALAVPPLRARRTGPVADPDGAPPPARAGPTTRRAVLRLLPWAVVATAVTVAAVGLSARATQRADVPPVQFSLGRTQGTTVEVVVSADRVTPPLELRTEADDGSSLSYPLIEVRPGAPVRTTVTIPQEGRYVITLSNPAQGEPLRSLTVDR